MKFLPRFFGLLWACVLACSLSAPVHSQTSVESIALKHQVAESVVQKLTPSLLPGEFASATGNNVLLSAQTENLAQYKALIAGFDQPAKRWLLEVRQGPLAQLQRESVFDEGVTVTSRGAGSGGGVMMIGRATGPQASRVVLQSLQVQEGLRVSIALGNSQALVLRTAQGREDGSVAAAASAVRVEAQSGLWLVLYPRDERIAQLELAPRSSDSLPRASTMVNIPVGTWATLAEAESDSGSKTAKPPEQRYVLQAKLSLQ